MVLTTVSSFCLRVTGGECCDLSDSRLIKSHGHFLSKFIRCIFNFSFLVDVTIILTGDQSKLVSLVPAPFVDLRFRKTNFIWDSSAGFLWPFGICPVLGHQIIHLLWIFSVSSSFFFWAFSRFIFFLDRRDNFIIFLVDQFQLPLLNKSVLRYDRHFDGDIRWHLFDDLDGFCVVVFLNLVSSRNF